MYNMNVTLTYNTLTGDASDTCYRKELLEVFSMTTFDIDIMNQKIEALYEQFKDDVEFVQCMTTKASRLLIEDPIVGFMLCFSFDDFHKTHTLIQEFHANKTVNNDLLVQLSPTR